MDRRDFLAARRPKRPVKQAENTAQTFRTQSGIGPYTGPWTEQELIHLLKRTMFGARKADVDYLLDNSDEKK